MGQATKLPWDWVSNASNRPSYLEVYGQKYLPVEGESCEHTIIYVLRTAVNLFGLLQFGSGCRPHLGATASCYSRETLKIIINKTKQNKNTHTDRFALICSDCLLDIHIRIKIMLTVSYTLLFPLSFNSSHTYTVSEVKNTIIQNIMLPCSKAKGYINFLGNTHKLPQTQQYYQNYILQKCIHKYLHDSKFPALHCFTINVSVRGFSVATKL